MVGRSGARDPNRAPSSRCDDTAGASRDRPESTRGRGGAAQAIWQSELWWPLIATDQGFFAPMFAKSRFPENNCVSLEGSGVGSERQLDPSNLTVRRSYQYLAGASSG